MDRSNASGRNKGGSRSEDVDAADDPGERAFGTRPSGVRERGRAERGPRREDPEPEPPFTSFEDVYRRKKNYVWRLLRAHHVRTEAAERIHGKVFWTMYVFIRDERKMPDNVTGMLYTLTKNELLNHWRLRDPDRMRDAGVEVDALAHPGPDPAEALLEREQREQIDDLLDHMPQHEANRIRQFDLGGLEYDEIAEATGCPAATLRTQHRRARASFLVKARRFFKVGGDR